LYVVLAERPTQTEFFCAQSGLPVIPAALRLRWLKNHFIGRKNIRFLYMDETDVQK
jgi:hypothetical protein